LILIVSQTDDFENGHYEKINEYKCSRTLLTTKCSIEFTIPTKLLGMNITLTCEAEVKHFGKITKSRSVIVGEF